MYKEFCTCESGDHKILINNKINTFDKSDWVIIIQDQAVITIKRN